MKTRNAMLLLALLLASCTTKNENSALVITKVIPATATGGATSLSCVFQPGSQEFTPFLPFNPAENFGIIAAVVTNNIPINSTLNPLLREDTSTFLPHQVVLTYEYLGSTIAPPAIPNVVPTSGIEVPGGGGNGTVGMSIFNGVNLAPLATGTYVRATFHIEGKLLDGSSVRTAEREYLFQVCHTAGCGLGGYYSAPVGTGTNPPLFSCF